MATLIGKPVGQVIKEVADLEQGRIFQSPLNKGWRALILLKRATSGMPKDTSGKSANKNDSINHHIATPNSISDNPGTHEWMVKHAQVRNGTNPEDVLKSDSIDYTKANQMVSDLIKNDIVIANLNVSPAVSIVIQNRPDRLRVDPTSTWAAVKSMGRNNPFYFYTGGEDTISLDISWYAIDREHRDDVVNKCRLLESWTRANGYLNSPPTLKIQWGNSGIFDNDLFILTSASYELTHFQNGVRMMKRYDHDTDTGQRITSSVSRSRDLKLLPNCATQTLVFKRVSKTNRLWEDIIPTSKLQRTPGINYTENKLDTLENSGANE